MKFRIKEEYWNASKRWRSPATHKATLVGDTVNMTIKLDPILKKRKHTDLKRAVIKHEVDEVSLRAKGVGKRDSHKQAMAKEQRVIHKMRHPGAFVRNFWNEIDRRG